MYRIYLVAAIALLSVCGWGVDARAAAVADKARVNEFNIMLAKEYNDFAAVLFKELYWSDSRYFKHKAESALRGEKVLPEDSAKWHNIGEQESSNLKWAYGRLENIMLDSVQDDYPEELARLQKLYDCWVERVSSGAKQNKIEECRMEFVLEISAMESILMPAHTL